MNKSGNELQFVQLDADLVGLAEKVLVKQCMSVEEYLTAALKRVYVSDELPIESVEGPYSLDNSSGRRPALTISTMDFLKSSS
ncbi:hypothetical protein [Weissella paramesenteroides]|uniref:hypothetical protein n=1 Tax=Weissella paramesenteroides TaxID=1249 RepID=UPI00103FBB08|nr:hypothetical protein [Weissella paramesenteroides]RZQ57452.1 hypothetical protein EWR19_09735 [Weissella paramesenteroides]